eukprot:4786452-Alexandrium_andersonii.AAC.1
MLLRTARSVCSALVHLVVCAILARLLWSETGSAARLVLRCFLAPFAPRPWSLGGALAAAPALPRARLLCLCRLLGPVCVCAAQEDV